MKLFGGFIDFGTCDLWEKYGCLSRRSLETLDLCDQGKWTFSGSHWRFGMEPDES